MFKKISVRLYVITTLILVVCTPHIVFSQDGIWVNYTRANSGLIGDSVLCMSFDANNTIWLAAWQGVAKQTATGWKFYNDRTNIPSNDIADIDYANASMWFGHHDGLAGFDGTTWVNFTTTNSGLVNTPILSLAHDNQGDLWIATARGLGRYSHDKVWTSYKHATVSAMPYDGIQAIATDASNTLWMAFIGTAGIVFFPGGNSIGAKYLKQDSIPGFPKGAVYIMCLAVDWSGNLWAGTAKNGVVRINASGATVFSRSNTTAIKNDTINTVTIDRCGHVWIGTDKGAAMYDGSSWFGFSSSTGNLMNDYIFAIKADGPGHVWIGTKGGVAEFKPYPEAPVLISPLMSMTMNSDTVICKWAWSCPGIIKYWCELADNPNFTNAVIDTNSTSLTESASKMHIGLKNNSTYYWRVKAKNDAGWGPFSNTWVFYVSFPSGVSMMDMMNSHCTLMQNYPNPCDDRTTIGFSMPRHEHVSLAIYDMLGRKCMSALEGEMGPGNMSFPLDVSGLLLNGVYIYRLSAGNEVVQRCMHVMR